MKILQILKTSDGATWAYEQSLKLKEKNVETITILPTMDGKMVSKYQENNMKIYELDLSLPLKKPWEYFKKKEKLKKIIEYEQPDLIHIHFVTNMLMLRIALRHNKIPRLFQVPGPLHLESKFFRKLDIALARENDYWAPACCMSEQSYLNENITKNKVFLAYYGVNNMNYYFEKARILHDEYSIPEKNIVIAMVSYFYKPKKYLGQKRGLKGHEDFIDAIEILNKKYSNITALIIGSAWGNSKKYEKKVIEYAKNKKIENIIFTGFRNDIKQIYTEIDIAVHPSHSENLGGAAESLTAGVPTIATNVGGFPDIVIDGVTGYLCDKKNPQSIADCIEKMITDTEKTKQMAIEGQKKVKKLLDINNTANKIYEIYNKILES